MKSLAYTTALCAALAFAAPAMAQEELDTSEFTVNLTVLPECTISVDDLTIDPVEREGSTALDIECNTNVTVQVGLSGGGGASRTLSGPEGTVAYNLYQEATFDNVWGDIESTRVDFTLAENDATGTIYAQIDDAVVTLPVGEYSDTVVATLYYTFAEDDE